MIQKWSHKRSRSCPRDTSKEKQQNSLKVYQKVPEVDQKAPLGWGWVGCLVFVFGFLSKKDFKITKNSLGGLLFHIKKTMIIRKLFFLVFCPPREVPDPENQAKTQ